MEIHRGLAHIPNVFCRNVVALGNFDGVHRGHREIFKITQQLARERQTNSMVLTFEPHPATVLRPDRASKLLTSYEHKLELIGECGIEYVVVLNFDTALSQTTHTDFIGTTLVDTLDVKHVVMGQLARFGKGRLGDAAALATAGETHDFTVTEVTLLGGGTSQISSSAIRRAIIAGEVAGANQMLGRAYRIDGIVVAGDGRGKTIGVPTANLQTTAELIPSNGVYACYAILGNERFAAAVNVGVTPTFDGDMRSIEAHIIGFDREIYSEALALEFVGRIRDERRFNGVDQLVKQINADIKRVEEILQCQN